MRMFLTSKKTIGISIASLLITLLSYFIANPLFNRWFSDKGLIGDGGEPVLHGYPFNYLITTRFSGMDFNIFYFVLDFIFWFIVVYFVVMIANLIRARKMKKLLVITVIIIIAILSLAWMKNEQWRKCNTAIGLTDGFPVLRDPSPEECNHWLLQLPF
jgi:hypothetical protein